MANHPETSAPSQILQATLLLQEASPDHAWKWTYGQGMPSPVSVTSAAARGRGLYFFTGSCSPGKYIQTCTMKMAMIVGVVQNFSSNPSTPPWEVHEFFEPVSSFIPMKTAMALFTV